MSTLSINAISKKVEDNRDLLISALNRNQVTFAQIAKCAEFLSNGTLKFNLDPASKIFSFDYLDKHIEFNMKKLKLSGIKYINDVSIDELVSYPEFDSLTEIIKEVQDMLLDKADIEHVHTCTDITDLQSELDTKANKIHNHSYTDISDLQSILDTLAPKEHSHNIGEINELQSNLDSLAKKLAIILAAMSIDSIITFNKNVNINGVTITGVAHEPLKEEIIDEETGLPTIITKEDATLVTSEYIQNHKDEFKGEKGDPGPQGPKGEKGDNGLDGEDGEDGEDAKNWLWNLINSGLTAGSYAALAASVSALEAEIAGITAANAATDGVQTAADIVDTVGDVIDDFSELSDEIETQTFWGKVMNWFQQLWTKIQEIWHQLTDGFQRLGTVQEMAQNNQLILEESSSITNEAAELRYLLPLSMRAIGDDSSPKLHFENAESFIKWLVETFPDLGKVLGLASSYFKDYNIEFTEEQLTSYYTYIILAALYNNIDENINNKEIDLSSKADKEHTHMTRDITDLQEVLDTKADAEHEHDITIQTLTLDLAHIQHTHKCSEIVDLQSALDLKSDKGHVHTCADISDLQYQLDQKANKVHIHSDLYTKDEIDSAINELDENTNRKFEEMEETYNQDIDEIKLELANHTHTAFDNDVIFNGSIIATGTVTATNLLSTNETRLKAVETKVETKANSTHTHTCSQITDLEQKLKAKSDTGHVHTCADITDLEQKLKDKADSVHTHTCSDITDFQNHTHTSFNSDIEVNGSAYQKGKVVPSLVGCKFLNSVPSGSSITIDDSTNPKTKVRIIAACPTLANHVGKYVNITISDETKNWSVLSLVQLYTGPNDSIEYKPNFDTKGYKLTSAIEGTSYIMDFDWSIYEEFITRKFILSIGLVHYSDSTTSDTTKWFTYKIEHTFEQYYSEPKIVPNQVVTKQYLLDMLYPVGAIYMSMNNVNPRMLFGGTWTQIQDRFLLCSAGESKQPGGSKTIETKHLPPHTHSINNLTTSSSGNHAHSTYIHLCTSESNGENWGITASDSFAGRPVVASSSAGQYNDTVANTASNGIHTHTINGTTSSIGSGVEFWPQHITCYCWYRTA